MVNQFLCFYIANFDIRILIHLLLVSHPEAGEVLAAKNGQSPIRPFQGSKLWRIKIATDVLAHAVTYPLSSDSEHDFCSPECSEEVPAL